jgi:hypothetical protein
MRQALHILKKDARKLRMYLLLIYVVMLVQTAITVRDPLTHEPLQSLIQVAFLVPLSILVVAGMLIQEEPMVGTTAFWMTRPMGRGSLLLSKVLFLSVFVIVPALIATLVVGLAYGIDLTRMAPAVGDSFLTVVSMLLVAVLLAALTPNVPIYFMAGIGFVVANQLLEASKSITRSDLLPRGCKASSGRPRSWLTS